MTDKIKVEIDGDHEDCKSNPVKYQFISYEVLIFECRWERNLLGRSRKKRSPSTGLQETSALRIAPPKPSSGNTRRGVMSTGEKRKGSARDLWKRRRMMEISKLRKLSRCLKQWKRNRKRGRMKNQNTIPSIRTSITPLNTSWDIHIIWSFHPCSELPSS